MYMYECVFRCVCTKTGGCGWVRPGQAPVTGANNGYLLRSLGPGSHSLWPPPLRRPPGRHPTPPAAQTPPLSSGERPWAPGLWGCRRAGAARDAGGLDVPRACGAGHRVGAGAGWLGPSRRGRCGRG